MKLREWLYQSRLTITDFAKMLEVDRTYLQMLLSGKKQPSRKLETRIQELTEQKVSSITDIQDQQDTQDKKDNMKKSELRKLEYMSGFNDALMLIQLFHEDGLWEKALAQFDFDDLAQCKISQDNLAKVRAIMEAKTCTS